MKYKFLIPALIILLFSCKSKKNTETEQYYDDGTLKKKVVYTSSDKKAYRVYEYYENANPKSINEYLNGLLHGRSSNYYSTGLIQTIFYYRVGRLNSIARYYDEYSRLTDKGLFINDSLTVKEEYYYKDNRIQMNVFSRLGGNFSQAGSLLYNLDGLFGADNSFYYIVNSADSIKFTDSLKVDVTFIAGKARDAQISLKVGTLNMDLDFVNQVKSYSSDSSSLSFYFKPTVLKGYNLILGKLNYHDKKAREKEFIFYHDFLVY